MKVHIKVNLIFLKIVNLKFKVGEIKCRWQWTSALLVRNKGCKFENLHTIGVTIVKYKGDIK